jgi:hypothetical protein
MEASHNTESENDVQIPNMQQDPSPNVNEFNPDDIVCDPALRRQIASYSPAVQDQVRRAYILKGPTQPVVKYLRTDGRAFSQSWFQRYNWIEYSVSKHAAFCFYCFLFKNPGSAERFGYDVFTKTGFKDWKHAYKALPEHIGGVGSDHNNCVLHCDALKNQNQSVATKLARVTDESKELYKIRLTSSLECCRYLMAQGLSFRGHDESSTSLNKGNFLEMIDMLKDGNEQIRDAFDRGGRNCQMTSGEIQKDLVRCCAEEVTEVIMGDLGDKQFSVLIDESRDIYVKEQMAVMLKSEIVFCFIY